MYQPFLIASLSYTWLNIIKIEKEENTSQRTYTLVLIDFFPFFFVILFHFNA